MRVVKLSCRGRMGIYTVGLLVGLACAGCGSGEVAPSTEPGPLKDREAIIAALPQGVTLESPIEPNPLLGPNSKTVGEALASLQAYVRDGTIIDGGLGQEIRFDTGAGTKNATSSKAAKGAGGDAPVLVIQLKR